MPSITVSTTISASPSDVWAYVESIESHVEWMADAEALRFMTDQTSGVGTTFECDTKVGPLRTTDVMRITAWEPENRMGVEHIGLVEGQGDFFLQETSTGTTRFVWEEVLYFPWFFGGTLGGFIAKPALKWVWKRNLRKLSERVEQRARLGKPPN